MLLDKQLRLTENQAITTGSILSQNTIDLTSKRDVGEGIHLSLVISVTEAFAGGTGVTFEIISADNEALSVGVDVVSSSGLKTVASLKAGSQVCIVLDANLSGTPKRYLGLRSVVSGTNTAGKITADFAETIQGSGRFYPSGFTVA